MTDRYERIIKRADRAVHQPGQMHLSEFTEGRIRFGRGKND